ncbi:MULTISPECIES: response regulator [Bacillales]|uniref:Response regulator n=1 Tax=Lysinibacillus louembei TaxID=1470088 RepID=A0ABZ0RXE2_9BACI|nr:MULTISPECIES: response regulator [Bacillales]MCT6923281.1 response regulator [Metasolibacillus sp.]MCT6939414.1 response regulator [Metasolibacillus sp.]WPK11603.1 response regulator [Lysinibacillus louembei]
MKVLIVDDEPIMLLTMKRMLASIDGIELVGSFQQINEALAFLQQHEADIAFLDIEIAEDNGIELARNLRANNANLDIVFTTAHANYAMQAYDVYPLDYMLKPVSKSRLNQTIARAMSKRRTASTTENAVQNRLKVQTFGCLEVSSTQYGEVKWRSKKNKELFAYLLMKRGKSVAKMRLIEDVFPEMPVKNAETYLHTAVYQLRAVLKDHGFKSHVISGQEKYRLDLTNMDVDFLQFEQGVAMLTQINKDNEHVALELEKQVNGVLFEEPYFLWAAFEQESMSLLYTSFAKRLASWLLQRERYVTAVEIVRKIVVYDGFDEEANQLLLNLYGAMRDMYAFQQHYQQYVQRMQRELHLPPSMTMQQLYERYQKA